MILIRLRPDGIVGMATPPHGRPTWIIEEPISREDFCKGMLERGSHPTDAADVLAEADRTGFGYI